MYAQIALKQKRSLLSILNTYPMEMKYLILRNYLNRNFRLWLNRFELGRMLCSHCHGHTNKQQCHNFQLCEPGEVGTSSFLFLIFACPILSRNKVYAESFRKELSKDYKAFFCIIKDKLITVTVLFYDHIYHKRTSTIVHRMYAWYGEHCSFIVLNCSIINCWNATLHVWLCIDCSCNPSHWEK